MKDRFVIGVDQGTKSTRCIVFDSRGALVGMAQREHRQYFPRPGWVEHDAAHIWQLVRRLVPLALRQAGIGADQIVAIGIANQRETIVVWDRRTGRPVTRAIVWQDTRTSTLVDELRQAEAAARVQASSGLPFATYFSGPRLKWLLDNADGLRDRAERGDVLFGTMDSWLIWNLTGGPRGGLHITDVTNASRTMLMDIRTLTWNDEALSLFTVPRAMLPRIRSSIETFGLAVDALPGVPVAAALGDQQAALFGQTCFHPGEAKCTYGTGAFLLLNTGTEPVRSSHGLLTTVAYKFQGGPAVYALEGPIADTGSLIEWLRQIGLIGTAAEVETHARAVADNGGCYIVPAFSGLFAPYWSSHARAVIAGLTSYIGTPHLCRAALEAAAWQTREVLDAMNADSGLELQSLRVDGGMTANNLLMQLIADAIDLPVVRPFGLETVCLGAAYAAGLAVGFWADTDALRANWHPAAQWLPSMEQRRRDDEYGSWKRAVGRALDGCPETETASDSLRQARAELTEVRREMTALRIEVQGVLQEILRRMPPPR